METEFSDVPAEAIRAGDPAPPDSEILWDHVVPYGSIPRLAVIGYNDDYVWQGGWNGSARLFEMTGDGTPLWEIEFGNNNRISVAAAQTADIFYAAANNIANNAFTVYKFNHTSSTPDWVWDGAAAGYHALDLDIPGHAACSADGSVFAVGGHDGDSLAVIIFGSDSSTPLVIYEDETLDQIPQHVHLTADGSKCIFAANKHIYRLDVATGTMESTYDTGYWTHAFDISPDGSIVVVGFSSSRVLQWNGSEYVNLFVTHNSGYAGAAAVAEDNDTVAIAWRASDYLSVSLSLISIANGATPQWVWNSPQGSGGYQDKPTWIDISDNGEWIAFGSWGTEDNAHPEVMVFRSDTSTGPWFSIDTPGSVFHVDISSDGQYLCCGAKAVHANTSGSGGNVIAAYIDHTVAIDSVDLSAKAADDGVLLSWSVVGDTPASVSVLRGLTQNDTVALSGELSGSATSWLDVSVEAGVEYTYYLEVTELDGTVSRFGPSEVVVPVAVSELALSDPYPNPCSDSLTIHYELTQNATVKLHIYDVAGRLVETLVSGEQTAGRHSVNWDSSTAATGIYLLRLEAEGSVVTKRAVISR